MSELEVIKVGDIVDVVAADASELVLLTRTTRASSAHGTLPAGATSKAIVHRTVDEIWFVVSGSAEIWRVGDGDETIVVVETSSSLAIPSGTRFQYRTVGAQPFCFVMTTIPPWPGEDEAVSVVGIW